MICLEEVSVLHHGLRTMCNNNENNCAGSKPPARLKNCCQRIITLIQLGLCQKDGQTYNWQINEKHIGVCRQQPKKSTCPIMKGNTTDDIRPQRNNQTCEHRSEEHTS